MGHQENPFASRLLNFIETLNIPTPLPDDTELLYPYNQPAVQAALKGYYNKYYNDNQKRIFLIGINPGRFGGGVTGIPFTDTEELSGCGIDHDFDKSRELSSRFIYEMVRNYGGRELFFSRFFLTALSPLGFTWKGKNRNYYDTPALMDHLKSWLISTMQEQIELGADRKIALSLGQGKNYKILKELNQEYGFFNEIRPLPHPRWVMQYKLKQKQKYLNIYKDELNTAFSLQESGANDE